MLRFRSACGRCRVRNYDRFIYKLSKSRAYLYARLVPSVLHFGYGNKSRRYRFSGNLSVRKQKITPFYHEAYNVSEVKWTITNA